MRSLADIAPHPSSSSRSADISFPESSPPAGRPAQMTLELNASAVAAEFADAFSRLESIATLYPIEHARSREAGARVAAAIVRLSDARGTLCIELADDRLLFGGTSVALST